MSFANLPVRTTEPLPRRVALAACATAPIPRLSLGGTGAAVTAAAAALAARGVAVDVYAPLGSQVPHARVVGIEGRPATVRFGPGQDEARPGDLLLALWTALAGAQERYCAIINFASDWLPYYLADLFTTPVLNRVCLPYSHMAMADWVRHVALRRPEAVGFLSHAQAADFALPAHRKVMAHALAPEDFAFGARPEPGQLAFVGRLTPEKGLTHALAVAARAGRRLTVAGAGPEATRCAALAAEAGVRLDLRGPLDQAGVAALLRQSEALLMPSCWNEPFGRVAIEAMACGTPVIARKGGGPAEIIAGTGGGRILDDLDPDRWAAAVARAAAMDRAACRKAVLAAFAPARLADDLLGWIEAARAAKLFETAPGLAAGRAPQPLMLGAP